MWSMRAVSKFAGQSDRLSSFHRPQCGRCQCANLTNPLSITQLYQRLTQLNRLLCFPID